MKRFLVFAMGCVFCLFACEGEEEQGLCDAVCENFQKCGDVDSSCVSECMEIDAPDDYFGCLASASCSELKRFGCNDLLPASETCEEACAAISICIDEIEGQERTWSDETCPGNCWLSKWDDEGVTACVLDDPNNCESVYWDCLP